MIDDDNAGLRGLHRFERVSYRGERCVVVSRTSRSLSLQLHRLPRLSATSNGLNHSTTCITITYGLNRQAAL